MRCEYQPEFIHDYTEGKMSLEVKEKFTDHLRGCASCRSKVAADRLLLNSLAKDDLEADIPVEKVMQRINRDRYKHLSLSCRLINFLFRFRPLKGFRAAGAAVLALFALVLFIEGWREGTFINKAASGAKWDERAKDEASDITPVTGPVGTVRRPESFIASTAPNNGSENIPPDETIFVRFATDINPAVLVSGNISVYDVEREKDITTLYSLCYDEVSRELALIPGKGIEYLKAGERVKVTISQKVTDSRGNRPDSDFSFTFRVLSGDISERSRITEDWKETVVTNNCAVRSGPAETYRLLGSLEAGDTIILKGSFGGWYLALTAFGEAWVEGANIADYKYNQAVIGVVTADAVSLGSSEIKLERGNLVWIIKQDKVRSYARPVMIDINAGYSGWISNSDYVMPVKGRQLYYNQAFISTGTRIYSLPDTDSKVLYRHSASSPLFAYNVTPGKNGWSKVSTLDVLVEGWVRTDELYLDMAGSIKGVNYTP